MRFSQLLDKSASKKDVLELTSALALEQPLRAEDGELALRALGRKNCWEEALAWMATMQTSALQPSVICYSATMSACFRSAQWQRSLLCFDSLRASGCPPNAITFSAAISACYRGGLWVEALELLEEMRARDVEIDKEHYSAVLRPVLALQSGSTPSRCSRICFVTVLSPTPVVTRTWVKDSELRDTGEAPWL